MICPICGSVTEAFLLNIPNWFKWVESYCEFNGHFEPHFLELIFLPPGVSPASRPSPGTPTSPSNLSTGLKTPAPAPTTSHNPLANILSKVEITPESILSALSKTQTQSAPALQGKLTCATGTWILGSSSEASKAMKCIIQLVHCLLYISYLQAGIYRIRKCQSWRRQNTIWSNPLLFRWGE